MNHIYRIIYKDHWYIKRQNEVKCKSLRYRSALYKISLKHSNLHYTHESNLQLIDTKQQEMNIKQRIVTDNQTITNLFYRRRMRKKNEDKQKTKIVVCNYMFIENISTQLHLHRKLLNAISTKFIMQRRR